MKRADKLAKWTGLYDGFHAELSAIDDERARRECDNRTRVRSTCEDPDGQHTRAMLATGLEQGLREAPVFFRHLPPAMRVEAAKAFDRAIAAHYPELNAKDAARLVKIKARGRIRGDAEFHLALYQAGTLEGEVCKEQERKAWCALIGEFESRG